MTVRLRVPAARPQQVPSSHSLWNRYVHGKPCTQNVNPGLYPKLMLYPFHSGDFLKCYSQNLFFCSETKVWASHSQENRKEIIFFPWN